MWMKLRGVSRESKNGYGQRQVKIFVYSMRQILVLRAELETMLGSEFAGVLSSDDFRVYNGVLVGSQQKCLAHLRRHFKKVLLIGHGNNTVVASAFLELIDEAFRQHRIQGVNTLKNSIIILGRGTLRSLWQNC
jgi:hypothetical protein